MKKIRNFFTLVELIIVIIVLGVLASIIIPNIADMKKDSITTALNSNIRNIQTSTDIYSLKNGGNKPSILEPQINSPQFINFEKIYPNYLRSTPDNEKIPNQFYWLDYYGKVWGSTINNPSDMFESNEGLEWTKQEDAYSYNVYELSLSQEVTSAAKENRLKRIGTITPNSQADKIQLKKSSSNVNYLVSAVDGYGLETAPTSPQANKVADWFTPLVQKTGSFEYGIQSEELMYWIDYSKSEDKPEGTNITYQFSVEKEDGTFSDWTEDFKSLEPSKNIKIKVTLTSLGKNHPSLYSLRVFYSFSEEETLKNISRTFSKNIDAQGNVINEAEPTSVVDSFIVPENLKVANIETTDSFNPILTVPTIRYFYKEPNNLDWKPVSFLSDIPSGSTVKVEREYPNSQNLKVSEPVIKLSNDIKVQVVEGSKMESVVSQPEWTTIQTFSFLATTADGQRAKWTKLEVVDTEPENTKIEYSFKIANNGSWSKETTDILSLSASRSIQVIAKLQKKATEIDTAQDPSIESIRIHNERGYSDLSLVKPSAVIIPIKSNNKESDFFSVGTQIDWQYEAFDPRNKKIINVEWAGDKRQQYTTAGTYTVQLRVQNESGYWSDWVSYKLEVKPEKPTAVIGGGSSYSNITSDTKFYWNYSASYDPDGDKIVNAEWRNKQETYPVGTHTVELRVQDEDGYWSDWVSKTFTVTAGVLNSLKDLNSFSKYIYVDAEKGNDITGNGTQSNPYKTYNHAYQFVTSGKNEAMVLGKGIYTVSVEDAILKQMNIIGQGKDTVLYMDHSLRRITSSQGASEGVMYDLNKSSFYKLVFKETISGTNTFFAQGSGFYNVVFDVKSSVYSVISGDNTTVLYQTVDYSSIDNMLRGGIRVINSYGKFEGGYSTSANSYYHSNNILTNTPKVGQNYEILDAGWQNAGTGTNPDGSNAHIGVYGGKYSW